MPASTQPANQQGGQLSALMTSRACSASYLGITPVTTPVTTQNTQLLFCDTCQLHNQQAVALHIEPLLASWLFDKAGQVEFLTTHCPCSWTAKGRQLAGCHGYGISNVLATCVTYIRHGTDHIASCWSSFTF